MTKFKEILRLQQQGFEGFFIMKSLAWISGNRSSVTSRLMANGFILVIKIDQDLRQTKYSGELLSFPWLEGSSLPPAQF